MKQTRHLLIGGVALVPGRLRNAGPAMVAVCDRLEPLLAKAGWFPQAPFSTISLIFRFSAESTPTVEFQPINIQHNELPVAVALNMSDLMGKSEAELISQFMEATLGALRDIALRYELPLIEPTMHEPAG